MQWRTVIAVCTLLSAMSFRVNAMPHGYGQLTERQQDEFAAMIGEVFPEVHHHIRHATRRHWRNKLKPYSHVDLLKNVAPSQDERKAAADGQRAE